MGKSSKRKWWESSSAADDGDIALDDDGSLSDDDWVDRFQFSDYRADKGLSSTDAIWSRYGYSGSSFSDSYGGWSKSGMSRKMGVDFQTAKKIEAAQRLVQGFVDTFALDNPLSARFSGRTNSLGGEEGATNVVVSHRPLLDPTLTEQDAHRIMTAQAAYAAARARYGGEATDERNYRVANESYQYDTDQGAIIRELGRILDGYRIDSTFRRAYPGYDDVYAPAQRYIAKGLLKDREAFDLEDFAGASIANAALNFGDFTNWTGRESEREWWTNWADQYAHAPVADFAKGVVEALSHINTPLPPMPEPPKAPKGKQPPTTCGGEYPGGEDGGQPGSDPGPGGEPGEGKSKGGGKGAKQEGDDKPDQQGQGGESSDDTQDDDTPDTDSPTGAGSDPDDDERDDTQEPKSSDATDSDDWDEDPQPNENPKGSGSNDGSVNLPTGLGEGISLTGQANGQSQEIDEESAENLAQTAGAMVLGRDDQELGEVYWSTVGFKAEYGTRKIAVKPESSANGYIRRAFSRSRTAHYNTERGHLTGRIDNRSLPRIASDDYRLFSKRVAPSETKYRVWLLIDNSGSMGGRPVIDAANLASSVALAVRHIPNVVLDVWAWTSGIRIPGASFSAVRVYADGDPVSKIGDVGVLPQGGTPDGAVLSWAAREIRKQCRPDETPVILMASDGTGTLAAESWYHGTDWETNYRNSGVPESQIAEIKKDRQKNRVSEARKTGIKVLSVAIGNLDQASQDRTYGKGNHLLWNGSIKTMAKPLGDLLAKIASNRIK
jgi:Mg-chelatase subunit ChlD